MKKTLKLKRIMISYLDAMYPEIYLLRLSYLGDVVQSFDKEKQEGWSDNRTIGRSSNSWYDMRKKIIDTLSIMFCVSLSYSESVLNDWVNCRPKYEYIRDDRNEQVLVRVVEESHMTI